MRNVIITGALGLLAVTAIFFYFLKPESAPKTAEVTLVKEPLNPKTYRILCLGDPPPYRDKAIDGIRVQIPPSPRDTPPELVRYLSDDRRFEGALNLNIGKPSSPFQITGDQFALLRESDRSPWCTLKTSAGMKNLGLILRRPDYGNTWERVGTRVLRDDFETFPKGSFRFVNMSLFSMNLKINEEILELPRGEVLVYGNQPLETIRLQMSYLGKGDRNMILYSNVYEHRLVERTNIFIYPADGGMPGKSVRVKILSE